MLELTALADLFLQMPRNASERVLHPGRLTGGLGTTITAVFEAPGLEIPIGREVAIYYNLRQKFVRQDARIVDVLCDESDDVDGLQVTIEKTGEPMLAESRACFRVSTVLEGISIGFGQHSDCPLADISHTGFAVISTEIFEIGCVVPTTLRYNDLAADGYVRVQSKRGLTDGRFRYGTFCFEKSLEKTIQTIVMVIQREQLQRLAAK